MDFTTAGLLSFGGFIFGIGWFAGVAGLWMGTRWKLWEKVIGTALLPGGVFGGWVLPRLILWPMAPSTNGGSEPVIPGLPPGATAILLCVPVLVCVYLVVTGFRRPSAHLSATSASIRHN
ncbi:hypothetical protein AAFM46_05080 [Arthrobacter sp. TMP15]|uniref:hypothetical protein n=1 Tax=Arthrobacter sp. TMP15 TaxID=3140789 RepID=UPI0031BB3475